MSEKRSFQKLHTLASRALASAVDEGAAQAYNETVKVIERLWDLERENEWLREELSKLTDEPCPHCGRMMVPRHCRDHRRHHPEEAP